MVEELEVSISPSVIDYLDHLVYKLYQEGYFSYLEYAENYVTKLYDSIPISIKSQRHIATPLSLISYGNSYVSYQSSKRTTWYFLL